MADFHAPRMLTLKIEMKMNTDKKYRKHRIGFAKSRKKKDRIINVAVGCIIAFIALLLIYEIA